MNEGKVSLLSFFKDIVSLSFMGDIRTYLKAERKDKVDNIVIGAFEQYVKLYDLFFKKYNITVKDDLIYLTPDILVNVYDNIPKAFLQNVKINSNNYISDKEFKLLFLIKDTTVRRSIITQYIKKLNFRYSLSALLTGIYSSNFAKIVSFYNYRSLTY
jgi:hypothetical protein